MKNVAIPATQIGKALKSGISFDGSSIEGFARIQESDMVLRPDLSTFSLLPWRAKDGSNEARLICDVHLPDGNPFEGDPRRVLRKLEKAQEMGSRMNVGPELEFFLFEKQNGGTATVPHDLGGYFDLGPIDLAEEMRPRLIAKSLMQMGFTIEASHHEVGKGQHEIRLHLR